MRIIGFTLLFIGIIGILIASPILWLVVLIVIGYNIIK